VAPADSIRSENTALPAVGGRDGTIRVVGGVLVLLGALILFQHVPTALRWPVRLLALAILAWLAIVTWRKMRASRFSPKGIVFSLLLGGFMYLALALICHIFNTLMAARDDRVATHNVTSLGELERSNIEIMLNGTSFKMYDPEVGWVPRPGRHADGTINAQGVRSLREYAVPATDPARRVLCLGDSYTFGDEVGDLETFPSHAEQLLPGTEWINLGISSTCLAQSLMRYRKSGKKLGGKHVVIGFMTDDAKRTVNCFRGFLTPYNPYTKPFAKLSNGRFSLEPNPYRDLSDYRQLMADDAAGLARLRKLDYLTWSNQEATSNPVLRTFDYVVEAMNLERNLDGLLNRAPRKPASRPAAPGKAAGDSRPASTAGRWPPLKKGADPYGKAIWNPHSLGFEAITRLFDMYYSEVIADGRVPLIVIIPGPFDVENERKHYPRIYDALLDHFNAKGYHYLDFLDTLVAHHKNDFTFEALFGHCHFRGSTNKELALEIIRELHL
jgi:hypothetical protein